MTPSTDKAPAGDQKAMTLRLPSELHERLVSVAEVEGEPIAEVVRRAVTEHVERRRHDPDFRAKLDATLRQNKRLLDLLVADEPGGEASGSDGAPTQR